MKKDQSMLVSRLTDECKFVASKFGKWKEESGTRFRQHAKHSTSPRGSFGLKSQ